MLRNVHHDSYRAARAMKNSADESLSEASETSVQHKRSLRKYTLLSYIFAHAILSAIVDVTGRSMLSILQYKSLMQQYVLYMQIPLLIFFTYYRV